MIDGAHFGTSRTLIDASMFGTNLTEILKKKEMKKLWKNQNYISQVL